MELILDSCNTMNNSKVSLDIWSKCMALDLYFLRFHRGYVCIFSFFLEKVQLVVCSHREHPKVHMRAFLGERGGEITTYLETTKLEVRIYDTPADTQ